MASLYLDSDVSVRLAPRLRAAGHDAVTAQDLGLRRATDDQQLLATVQHGRILLTHNLKDFVLLHDAWHRWPAAFEVTTWPTHPGILVLEQRLEDELAAVLTAFLSGPAETILDNRLHWWRRAGGWRTRRDDGSWAGLS